jgi:hypothetical protein
MEQAPANSGLRSFNRQVRQGHAGDSNSARMRLKDSTTENAESTNGDAAKPRHGDRKFASGRSLIFVHFVFFGVRPCRPDGQKKRAGHC